MKKQLAGTMESFTTMKIINDSVHGHIELPRLCMRIVDTLQFQRLRDLKQLGTSYYVYPGASHNRFEHSIGVCYLAGEYGRHLQRQQPELGITEKDILCLQVAGLCHDVGHGPFSHLWERFMNRVKPNQCWKHERISIQMLKHIVAVNGLGEDFTEDDINFIGELIWREENQPMSRPDKPYLYEIVSNKATGIDVDKWDYLLRDGLHLNIKTSFDYNRVMKFSRVNYVCKELHITYRNKEIENLMEMYTIREKLHRQAYQHRVSKVIEEMIVDALVAADNKLKLSDASNDMLVYEKLSDYIFYQILHGPDSEAKTILERIQRREFYAFIGKFRVEDGKKVEAEQIRNDIANGVRASDIVVSQCCFNYGQKNKNPIYKACFFSKDDERKVESLTEKDIPSTLPKKYEEKVVFVFCKDNSKKEDAKAALQRWAKTNGVMLDRSC